MSRRSTACCFPVHRGDTVGVRRGEPSGRGRHIADGLTVAANGAQLSSSVDSEGPTNAGGDTDVFPGPRARGIRKCRQKNRCGWIARSYHSPLEQAAGWQDAPRVETRAFGRSGHGFSEDSSYRPCRRTGLRAAPGGIRGQRDPALRPGRGDGAAPPMPFGTRRRASRRAGTAPFAGGFVHGSRKRA